MADPIIIEADIPDALHDDFREALLKVPEQKNIGVLVAFMFMAGVNAQRKAAATPPNAAARVLDPSKPQHCLLGSPVAGFPTQVCNCAPGACRLGKDAAGVALPDGAQK